MYLECIRDCKAACCRDLNITLSNAEAKMFPANTLELWPDVEYPGGRVYTISGPFPFLNESKCSLYGKAERPAACVATPTSSIYCLVVRRLRSEEVVCLGEDDVLNANLVTKYILENINSHFVK